MNGKTLTIESKEVSLDTKILIISDDAFTRGRLVQSLTRPATRALAIPSQPGSLSSYLEQADLLILDLPQADELGFGLLAHVRQISTIPTIVLVDTGDYRVSIQGLDSGADHVMARPINYRELRARIRALMRRARTTARQGAPWAGSPTSFLEAPLPQGSPSNRYPA